MQAGISTSQAVFNAQIRMIQLQTMRLSSINLLIVSSRRNVLLTNEEAECDAVTTDDLEVEDDDGCCRSCILNNIDHEHCE
jgi:hypothetical protein